MKRSDTSAQWTKILLDNYRCIYVPNEDAIIYKTVASLANKWDYFIFEGNVYWKNNEQWGSCPENRLSKEDWKVLQTDLTPKG